MRRAFREHTYTVAVVYIVHKWSTYMEEETHTERAGTRVNRGQAVLYTGTQKEIWDTFVLFAYLLALFSQSYVLTLIFHHHFNSSNIYQSTLYTSYDNINQVCFTKPTDSLQTDAPKVSSYSTHTQQRQQQHTLVPKTRSPSPSPPKIAVSFGGKIYNVTLSRWRLTALKRLWRSVFQIDDFSNWKKNIDIRFAVEK